jgi:4-hydroxy-tetrahydrodipicolinate synthase
MNTLNLSNEQNIFSGVITAIATPFLASTGEVDILSFKNLVQSQKVCGVSGVVVCGTTGESPTLSEAEKKHLILNALSFQDSNFSIYVGTGTNSTSETIAATKNFTSLVAANGERPRGAMIVCPYYNKPNQDGLFAHFSEIALQCKSIKLCLYNVPGRTGSNLEPATAIKVLQNHSNIVAIKEAAGNILTIQELHEGLVNAGIRNQKNILSGDDPTFAAALLYGANGVISVSTHVVPKAMVLMFEKAKQGDLESLFQINSQLFLLHKELFCAPNPIPLKWFLAELKLAENFLRLPLTKASESDIKKMKYALENVPKKFLPQ